MKLFLTTLCALIFASSFSQSVAINTDGSVAHPSAIVDIKSTTKGLLAPRMTSVQRTGIGSPAAGLLIYDTDTNSYWYYNGSGWINLALTNSVSWLLSGNDGTVPSSNFIGTTDNQPLRFRVNNTWAGEIGVGNGNNFLGNGAGRLTAGSNNTAFGFQAMYDNTSGHSNTAVGFRALYKNFSISNTAVGFESMWSNTEGSNNSAFGYNALNKNTTGEQNVAIGLASMYSNINGRDNTAMGTGSLSSNTSGNHNVAAGSLALDGNTTGHSNVAVGVRALYRSSTSSNLVAIGDSALYNNNGLGNTAIGSKTLFDNDIGFYNTALGMKALATNANGSYNVAIGAFSDVRNDGSGAIAIGYNVVASANEIVIGNIAHVAFFAQGIYNATTSDAPNMVVSSDGRIRRQSSSARYKTDITDLDINTSRIYNLRPVSYTSIANKARYFGLIAEEVAQVIPELATFAREKDVIKESTSEKLIPDAVQYPMLSVLLLKEVQKHEQTITTQQKMIDELKKEIQILKSKIK